MIKEKEFTPTGHRHNCYESGMKSTYTRLVHRGSRAIGFQHNKTRSFLRTMASLPAGDTFFLDNFAARQWNDASYTGTQLSHDQADFVQRIHAHHLSGAPLVDGYAPFCKHLFIPNFTDATVGALKITPDNKHLLNSGYIKRRPEELAVLARWFPSNAVPNPPTAKYLDIILYSRVQLIKEYEALPSTDKTQDLPDAPWGIISIKSQDEGHETPMQPITMLRNSLGREEGGSGVCIDRKAYEASVAYWECHAVIQ